eukprot:TRINITY_DN5337_c0_g1_i2.p1 TRINITY_DN5337_c0_g1~~TRINITY_DN5337_c0_g1_i2.p1  ORF type:complete len:265 (-),score=43.22 TRINITY_DN5337_c0_g1_i2:116-910(-)
MCIRDSFYPRPYYPQLQCFNPYQFYPLMLHQQQQHYFAQQLAQNNPVCKLEEQKQQEQQDFQQQQQTQAELQIPLKIEEINQIEVNENSNNIINDEIEDNFSNRQQPLIRKQKISQITYERSLARRNIKINFFTGLCHFIKHQIHQTRFKIPLFPYKARKLRKISNKLQFLYNHLRDNQNQFRTLSGWKSQMKSEQFGGQLQKYSRYFFGMNYAQQYILNSKIQEKYKELYIRQIAKFYNAALRPDLFNVPYFKPSNRVEKINE